MPAAWKMLCWTRCLLPCPLCKAASPAQVCGAIFRMDSNADGPGVRYVYQHPDILNTLFQGCGRRMEGGTVPWAETAWACCVRLAVQLGLRRHAPAQLTHAEGRRRRYNNPAIALNCGSMLRDCVRDENLAGCGARAAAPRAARLSTAPGAALVAATAAAQTCPPTPEQLDRRARPPAAAHVAQSSVRSGAARAAARAHRPAPAPTQPGAVRAGWCWRGRCSASSSRRWR